ncbi:MAG: hypothetical protein HC882_06835 [Acidobacteria bacterium]|nr:hypothetical protein [Acidobacteriota bacterium]
MNDFKKASEDLSFVREAITRAHERTSPPSIYVLWGLITLAGMPLFDVDPRWGGMFFAFAGPIGGILSGVLGARFAKRIGQESREQASQHAMHWTAMMVAILGVVGLDASGAIEGPVAGRLILLIIAFAYFTAGLYLDRVELWLGLLTFACFVGMFFVHSYEWTITGIVIGAGLFLAAAFGGRRGSTRS